MARIKNPALKSGVFCGVLINHTGHIKYRNRAGEDLFGSNSKH
jgi:hypothetical protein